jgi:hypothetical protein
MTADMSLSEQIRHVMAPLAESTDEPLFTLEHLVAMALYSTQVPMSRREIGRWIIQRSGYYADLAARRFMHLMVTDLGLSFEKTFQAYDLPIDEREVERFEVERFTITTTAATMLLSEKLQQTSEKAAQRNETSIDEAQITVEDNDLHSVEGSFTAETESDDEPLVTVESDNLHSIKASSSPDETECNDVSIFWSLPSELRNRIFEYVFQYPPSLRTEGFPRTRRIPHRHERIPSPNQLQ